MPSHLCAGVIFFVSVCTIGTVILSSGALNVLDARLQPSVIGGMSAFSYSNVHQAVVSVHRCGPHFPFLLSRFCFFLSGVCLIAICLACCRKVRRDRRVEERRTMDMLGKRRAAPAVSLAVEGIQQPDSPDQVGLQGHVYHCSLFGLHSKENFCLVEKSSGAFPAVVHAQPTNPTASNLKFEGDLSLVPLHMGFIFYGLYFWKILDP